MLSAVVLVVSITAAFGRVTAGDPYIQLVDGDSIALEQFANDKPVLLKFWATWCVMCIEQMPEYRELYADHGTDIQFLAVNVAVSDPPQKVRNAIAEHELEMPVAYDASGDLWKTFGVRGTPTYVLINAAGAVVHTGFRHDDSLKTALASVSLSRASGDDEPKPVDHPQGLLDIDGNPVVVGANSSGTLLAYHFATWCESYLEHSYAELAARCEQFRGDLKRLTDTRIVGFATLYSSTEESVRDYQSRHGITHPLVFDELGTFASLSGVRDFPYVIVIRDGTVVHASDRIDANVMEALGKSP